MAEQGRFPGGSQQVESGEGGEEEEENKTRALKSHPLDPLSPTGSYLLISHPTGTVHELIHREGQWPGDPVTYLELPAGDKAFNTSALSGDTTSKQQPPDSSSAKWDQ